jgi:hypothetical protein
MAGGEALLVRGAIDEGQSAMDQLLVYHVRLARRATTMSSVR